MKNILFIVSGVMVSVGSLALGKAKEIPELGKHYPVFIFEKNENPENVLVTYVKLTDSCQLQANPNQQNEPFFDFYWLMNRKKYKPVHKLIESGIRKRLEYISQSKDLKSFTLRLNDLSEIDKSLGATDITITARKNGDGSGCKVDGIISLGPSKEAEKIRLETIYSQSKKTLLPPFRKIESVTLTGFALKDGEKVVRTY